MTISGETIDYGPCAFMDAFDPATVFSSIDHARPLRLRQPAADRAVEPGALRRDAAAADRRRRRHARSPPPPTVLDAFAARYDAAWTRAGCAPSSGWATDGGDDALVDDLLALLQAQRVDYTSFFRALSTAVRGDAEPHARVHRPRRDRRVARPAGRTALARPDGVPDEIADGDGPRQPGLHPAQPPRRGGAGRGRRPATWSRSRGCSTSLAQPVRRAPRPGGLRRAGAASFGAYRTFCGT